jgi:hypothetical protein
MNAEFSICVKNLRCELRLTCHLTWND